MWRALLKGVVSGASIELAGKLGYIGAVAVLGRVWHGGIGDFGVVDELVDEQISGGDKPDRGA